MREFMNLIESFVPPPELSAVEQQVQVLRDKATEIGERAMQARLAAVKKLYPDHQIHWTSGMGSVSIDFAPMLENVNADPEDGYGIDTLIGQVERNDYAVAEGDERMIKALQICESVFELHDYLYDTFSTEVSDIKL